MMFPVKKEKMTVILFSVLCIASTASASVFLGGVNDLKASPFAAQRYSCRVSNVHHQMTLQSKGRTQEMARNIRRTINPTTKGAAMAIPGVCV